ncbi:MAG: hypothetical protein LBC60_07980, partial [Spirochaetaceae bacterium]|nr:hypothetical protein [Spirochaetaceae bacterium]
LGEGAGTVETTTLGTSPVPTIGGKGITTTLLAANLNVTSATAADRKLNSLTGPSATPNGTIKPAAVSTATVNNDVVIVSNAIFVPAP